MKSKQAKNIGAKAKRAWKKTAERLREKE